MVVNGLESIQTEVTGKPQNNVVFNPRLHFVARI